MWSSKPLLRIAFVALTLLGATALAGCTGLTPVYSERGIGAERHALNYSKPNSRHEQIIYQELKLRLGGTAQASDPTVRISTSAINRDLTESTIRRPSEPEEAVVTAKVEVVNADGKIIYTATRSANAAYMIDNQALSQAEAERDAEERAAKALAETIRLTLIGALAQPAA